MAARPPKPTVSPPWTAVWAEEQREWYLWNKDTNETKWLEDTAEDDEAARLEARRAKREQREARLERRRKKIEARAAAKRAEPKGAEKPPGVEEQELENARATLRATVKSVHRATSRAAIGLHRANGREERSVSPAPPMEFASPSEDSAARPATSGQSKQASSAVGRPHEAVRDGSGRGAQSTERRPVSERPRTADERPAAEVDGSPLVSETTRDPRHTVQHEARPSRGEVRRVEPSRAEASRGSAQEAVQRRLEKQRSRLPSTIYEETSDAGRASSVHAPWENEFAELGSASGAERTSTGYGGYGSRHSATAASASVTNASVDTLGAQEAWEQFTREQRGGALGADREADDERGGVDGPDATGGGAWAEAPRERAVSRHAHFGDEFSTQGSLAVEDLAEEEPVLVAGHAQVAQSSPRTPQAAELPRRPGQLPSHTYSELGPDGEPAQQLRVIPVPRWARAVARIEVWSEAAAERRRLLAWKSAEEKLQDELAGLAPTTVAPAHELEEAADRMARRDQKRREQREARSEQARAEAEFDPEVREVPQIGEKSSKMALKQRQRHSRFGRRVELWDRLYDHASTIERRLQMQRQEAFRQSLEQIKDGPEITQRSRELVAKRRERDAEQLQKLKTAPWKAPPVLRASKPKVPPAQTCVADQTEVNLLAIILSHQTAGPR